MGSSAVKRADAQLVGLGKHLTFRGERMTIIGYAEEIGTRDRVVVLEGGGRQINVSWANLWTEIERTTRRQPALDALDQLPRAAFEDLSEAEQAALLPRIRDALQVITGSRTGTPELDRSNGTLDPDFDPLTTEFADRVRAMTRKLQFEQRSRSRMTLYRDCSGLQALGLNYFVHGNRKTVAALPSIDADTEDELRRFVAAAGSDAQRSQRHLVVATRSHFLDRGLDLALTTPELTKWLGFLTRGKALHREARSRQTHVNKPEGVYGRISPTRPGEYVQVDATDTAIHCLFPGLGWAKASILVAVDVYSRCVVAVRVVPGKPNSRDVALLLYDMALPQAMRAGYPYSYQYYCGTPRLVEITTADGSRRLRAPESLGEKPAVQATHVVFDRGREMENLHLMAAAEEAGIGLVFCPPGAPYAKGVIESINRMLTRVQELLPAYKGASPANHPKGVESRALLTVGDLQDAIWSYVLTIYHHRPHKELASPLHTRQKSTPAEAYQQYLDHGGWIPVANRWDRMISFLPREQRRVQEYGINFGNHIYNSAELVEIRQHVQRGVGTKAIPLTVYYDPYDVTRVFVRHPLTQKWLRIPMWDPLGLAMPPYSDVLTNVAVERALESDSRRLSKTALPEAEARFQAAWSRGVFEDRREERAAALEAARRAQHAFDLELAGDEFRSFAYGAAEPSEPAAAAYDDDPDDQVLSYDDIDLDGMAWS